MEDNFTKVIQLAFVKRKSLTKFYKFLVKRKNNGVKKKSSSEDELFFYAKLRRKGLHLF